MLRAHSSARARATARAVVVMLTALAAFATLPVVHASAAHAIGTRRRNILFVLTDDQTGGRGRHGRSWEVPPRASIAVSAVVPAPDPEELGWVSLLAGVALVRAVRAVTTSAGTPVEPRLKWPNDVLLPADDDRKVAGSSLFGVNGCASDVRLVRRPRGHRFTTGKRHHTVLVQSHVGAEPRLPGGAIGDHRALDIGDRFVGRARTAGVGFWRTP